MNPRQRVHRFPVHESDRVGHEVFLQKFVVNTQGCCDCHLEPVQPWFAFLYHGFELQGLRLHQTNNAV